MVVTILIYSVFTGLERSLAYTVYDLCSTAS